MFRLYDRRAAAFTRSKDMEGEEVLEVRREHRPPIPILPIRRPSPP